MQRPRTSAQIPRAPEANKPARRRIRSTRKRTPDSALRGTQSHDVCDANAGSRGGAKIAPRARPQRYKEARQERLTPSPRADQTTSAEEREKTRRTRIRARSQPLTERAFAKGMA